MDFKMSNFQIGINKNGFHFRDSESGVIFTLIQTQETKVKIAICAESASEQICEELQNWLKLEAKKAEIGIEFVENIMLEKCYISDNQEFKWSNIAMDSFGIKNENKIIAFKEILNTRPVVGIFVSEIYDAEYSIQKLFELCSSDIEEIEVNVSGYASCIIKKHYELVTTCRLLLQATEKALIKELKNNYGEPRYEVLPSGNIEIWYTKLDKIRIVKCQQEGRYMHFNLTDEKSSYVSCLIYVIEAMKQFSEIDKMSYIYQIGTKWKEFTITRKNIDSVIRDKIKKRKILLTT